MIADGPKFTRVKLTARGIEEIGALELPRQRIDFHFETMPAREIETFIARRDQHTLQRAVEANPTWPVAQGQSHKASHTRKDP